MPGKRSAGILLFRRVDGDVRVLLGHMGGPLWARRDAGGWTIPKGEYQPDEEPLDAARREFAEELGSTPDGPLQRLGIIRQRGGKQVEAFALEGDFDPERLSSNTFEIEWPPRSGRRASFPEAEEARWMTFAEARQLMLPSQLPLIEALETKLKG